MKNLIQEVSDLKYELKRKKEQLNNVISKIKTEITDKFYQYKEQRTFSHALFLVFGTYYEWYDYNVSRNIYLSIAKHWKTNEYLNYYNILKYSYFDRFGYGQEANIVGFVCLKKNLFCAIKHNIEEIWKNNVLKNNYKEGLEVFKQNISSNPELCYSTFSKYCEDKGHILLIINYPSLKIKDVVVYSHEELS